MDDSVDLVRVRRPALFSKPAFQVGIRLGTLSTSCCSSARRSLVRESGGARVRARERSDLAREDLLHHSDLLVGASDRRDDALVQVGVKSGGTHEQKKQFAHTGEVVGIWAKEDDKVVRVNGGSVLDGVPRQWREHASPVRLRN